MDLTIVIPVHNEEENLAFTITNLENNVKTPHLILIVNDHSSDGTIQVVNTLSERYPNIRCVNNTYPPGFGNCIRKGIEAAETEIFVLVMADLCDDPQVIDEMYNRIKSGYDIVVGSRYSRGGKRIGGPPLKAFFSRFVSLSLHWITAIPTRDIANAFKMYRKDIVKNIEIESHGFELSLEIPLKAYFKGYKITEIPTIWKERTKGKSSFKIFKVLPGYLKWYLWAIKNTFLRCFNNSAKM
jgi:glycosyltransferase involved in cell wall biosynthesis